MRFRRSTSHNGLSFITSFLLRVYQYTVSPDHGPCAFLYGTYRCKFFPSCSEYTVRSVRQYGLLNGSMVSLRRLMRCTPWGVGGYDPTP